MSEKPGDNFVVLITREGMGNAAPELQMKLVATYLKLLIENGTLPKAICFYTEGVKLVVEGSPVLEQLQQLESKGVHLIICQTCLNYYNLREKVKVGIIGGMGDILAAQMLAGKVITL
ncbi:MAG: DsrE family protein [Verrucomicrobia bacterium]|nr:DsrE family protein [Verrucomicrobiota bacterium]